MDVKKAKDFNLKISSEIIESKYSVITNTDELDLPNENKVFQIAKNEELLDDNGDVQVYQADLNTATGIIEPMKYIDGSLISVYRKSKDKITKLEL